MSEVQVQRQHCGQLRSHHQKSSLKDTCVQQHGNTSCVLQPHVSCSMCHPAMYDVLYKIAKMVPLTCKMLLLMTSWFHKVRIQLMRFMLRCSTGAGSLWSVSTTLALQSPPFSVQVPPKHLFPAVSCRSRCRLQPGQHGQLASD